MSSLKFRYISDLHLEFWSFPVCKNNQGLYSDLIPDKNTILLVAGDTIPARFLQDQRTDNEARKYRKTFKMFLDVACQFKEVYMICGNHEHYGFDYVKTFPVFKEFLLKNNYTNVHLLENERVDLSSKVSLLAGTLWTDIDKDNPLAHMAVTQYMNDFRIIRYQDCPFTTDIALQLHKRSLKYFQQEILKDHLRTYIIMTHHLPTWMGVDPQYKGMLENAGYCSELEDFIHTNTQIAYWIHGHTHYNTDMIIGHTRMLSHQRGYPHHMSIRGSKDRYRANKEFII